MNLHLKMSWKLFIKKRQEKKLAEYFSLLHFQRVLMGIRHCTLYISSFYQLKSDFLVSISDLKRQLNSLWNDLLLCKEVESKYIDYLFGSAYTFTYSTRSTVVNILLKEGTALFSTYSTRNTAWSTVVNILLKKVQRCIKG